MNDYEPKPDCLKGRTILVTGASDGIGRAAAASFSEHGATVILLGRKQKKLEQVYDLIEDQGRPQPALFALDFTKAGPPHFDKLAESIAQEFGRLDGILHCAATLGTLTPLELFDDEVWSKVMQVNLQAPFWLTRACLPLLRESEDASIIFTTADVGRQGRAYWGAYSLAAAAVENMMQIWSSELSDNTSIRVNSIDPGAVRTFLRANSHPGEDFSELPAPEEVVKPFLYLIGPDSKGITGKQFSAQ